eukprot:scaffold1944_cov241-Pinguiococcus_pyrenoidosus.AAC.25
MAATPARSARGAPKLSRCAHPLYEYLLEEEEDREALVWSNFCVRLSFVVFVASDVPYAAALSRLLLGTSIASVPSGVLATETAQR